MSMAFVYGGEKEPSSNSSVMYAVIISERNGSHGFGGDFRSRFPGELAQEASDTSCPSLTNYMNRTDVRSNEFAPNAVKRPVSWENVEGKVARGS